MYFNVQTISLRIQSILGLSKKLFGIIFLFLLHYLLCFNFGSEYIVILPICAKQTFHLRTETLSLYLPQDTLMVSLPAFPLDSQLLVRDPICPVNNYFQLASTLPGTHWVLHKDLLKS